MADTKTLTIERIFDAPLARVWRAWTDPQEVMKWWGPQYFTSPECKIDFRVGGKYVFCMRAPEDFGGQNMYSTGTYKEIIEGKKIVYTDNLSDKDGNLVQPSAYGLPEDFPQDLLVTVEFEETPDGKTKMTLTHEGLPAGEGADQTEAGWNTSFDKLAESLKA